MKTRAEDKQLLRWATILICAPLYVLRAYAALKKGWSLIKNLKRRNQIWKIFILPLNSVKENDLRWFNWIFMSSPLCLLYLRYEGWKFATFLEILFWFRTSTLIFVCWDDLWPGYMRKYLLSISFKKSFPYRWFPFFLICGRQWRIFNGERKVHCTTISLIAFLYNNSFALLSLSSFALFIIDKWTIKVKSHRICAMDALEGEVYRAMTFTALSPQ